MAEEERRNAANIISELEEEGRKREVLESLFLVELDSESILLVG